MTHRSPAHAQPGRGPGRLRRRRHLTLGVAAGFMCAAVGAVGIPAASAGVSNSGEFELESTTPLITDSKGNIIPEQSGTSTDPNAVDDPAVAGDDWSSVRDGTSSASVSRFLTDQVGAGDDIFFQGGSKDPNDISAWKYTTNSVQDKNDIEHAFAARYNATSTLPAYLYFGLDRYATAGDATLGFWFLKGNLAKAAGGAFNTVHQENDLLVQIDYTTGGAQPTVAVSRWHNGALDNLGTSNTQLCGASTTQFYCASTNLQTETAPWAFVLKGTSGNSSFAPRTFFEGGVDLANFGLDRECFSSFLAETRSSQSFTSTLSDFALGNFASCSATETTTPSATTVSPGTGVTDTATITGNGVASAPYPTSSTTAPGLGNQVKFYLCGPMATGTCTSTASATPVPADKDLTPTSTQGVSTATSDPVNTASAPLAPGRYCWLATWAGDTNYPDGVSGETNPADECFTVRTIGTTTVTTPQSGGSSITTVPLGSTVTDHAVVTASGSGGGALAGNVAFYLCNPSQVVGGACPGTAGTAVGNPSVTPVAGSDPPSATADSTGTVVNAVGTWCFRATFTPTGSTYTGSSDSAATECFTVTDTTSATSAQDWLPNDTATITAGGASTVVVGTISIVLYPTSDCTGTPVSGQSYTSSPLSGTHSISFSTSNTTYKVTATGVRSWKVTFTSSNSNVGNSNHCETTSLTITN